MRLFPVPKAHLLSRLVKNKPAVPLTAEGGSVEHRDQQSEKSSAGGERVEVFFNPWVLFVS